jgi:hypothetical protein
MHFRAVKTERCRTVCAGCRLSVKTDVAFLYNNVLYIKIAPKRRCVGRREGNQRTAAKNAFVKSEKK